MLISRITLEKLGHFSWLERVDRGIIFKELLQALKGRCLFSPDVGKLIRCYKRGKSITGTASVDYRGHRNKIFVCYYPKRSWKRRTITLVLSLYLFIVPGLMAVEEMEVEGRQKLLISIVLIWKGSHTELCNSCQDRVGQRKTRGNGWSEAWLLFECNHKNNMNWNLKTLHYSTQPSGWWLNKGK